MNRNEILSNLLKATFDQPLTFLEKNSRNHLSMINTSIDLAKGVANLCINIGKQIKEQSEKAYNTTMNQIGDLISQLTLFKKQYDEEYKKELTRGVKTFKIFKLFYLSYYYDKSVCEGEESRRKDINLLRYVNNIGYELFGIKISNDNKINQKLAEFKTEAENLRKMAEKSLNISFLSNSIISLFVKSMQKILI